MLQLHHTEVTETNFFLWLCYFIHILNVPVNHLDPQEYVMVATVNLNPSYFTESLNPPLAVWANLSSLFKHFISQAPKWRSGPAVPDQRHFLFLWKAAGLMFTGKHLYKWVKKGLQVVKESKECLSFRHFLSSTSAGGWHLWLSSYWSQSFIWEERGAAECHVHLVPTVAAGHLCQHE